MQELSCNVDQTFIKKNEEIISFKCDLHGNLQQAMNKFVEDHPNLDQYKIIQKAIAGFLIEKGFHNRELTRIYLGKNIIKEI